MRQLHFELLLLAGLQVMSQPVLATGLAETDYGSGGGFNCTIRPLRDVKVSSSLRGVADKVLVKPGSRVNAGDPLIQLDAAMARVDLQLATARADSDVALRAAIINQDSLERKEVRLSKAYDAKAVSLSEHEQAELELALARNAVLREQQILEIARLDRSKAELVVEKSTIRSPVSGVVGEDLVDPGETVDDRHVATVYVNQPLRLEAYVPASELQNFLQRSRFAALVGERAADPVSMVLDYVSPVIDLASNTVSVFFTLDRPEILPGSKCLIAGEPASEGADVKTGL